MSDASVLTHEYDALAELAQALNAAAIVLKKDALRHPGQPAPDAVLVAASRDSVARTLRHVTALLATRGRPAPSTLNIPQGLVASLRIEYGARMTHFLHDLEDIAGALERGARLEGAQLRLLDEVSARVDTETSRVFRRFQRT